MLNVQRCRRRRKGVRGSGFGTAEWLMVDEKNRAFHHLNVGLLNVECSTLPPQAVRSLEPPQTKGLFAFFSAFTLCSHVSVPHF
jgi:hypothetical protein